MHDPFFINTAEVIEPIVNKPNDTGKKQFLRQNEALTSHEYLQYQQGWSQTIGDENFQTPYYLNHSINCWHRYSSI